MLNKFIVVFFLLNSIVNLCRAEEFLIEKIKFKGLQHISDSTAFSIIPKHLGNKINDEDISNIIHALFATGNFEDIKVLKEKNTLIIEVKEYPIISNIIFFGNKLIKNDILKHNLDILGIRKGEFFNRKTLLYDLKKEVLNFYHSIGRYNADIEFKILPLTNNLVDLNLIFKERNPSIIKRINIIGNFKFKTDKLLSLFYLNEKSKYWKLNKSSEFNKEKLLNDIETLRNYYLNHGYAVFSIDSTQINLSPDKKNVYITIYINEGDQYKISEIKLIGNFIEYEKEIKNSIKIKSGELYCNSKILKIKNDIKSILGRYGYAYPIINVSNKIINTDKTMKLFLNIDKGNRFYVNKIYFEGNNISKDNVLRREIRQMEGTWLNSELINEGEKRLNRLGYFEVVNTLIQKVPYSQDLVNVTYKIKEKNTGNLNFGIGYGSESGINFQIGMQQDNWLGTGYSIGINGTKNNYQNYSELYINNPYLTIYGTNLSNRIFYNNFRAHDADLSSYTNRSYGINNTLNIPIIRNNYLNIGLGYVHNELSNIKPQIAIWRYLNSIKYHNMYLNDKLVFATNDFTINYGWDFNNLDRFFLPTLGTCFNVNGKLTIPGSDNTFHKILININSYFPIDNEHKWVLLSRFRFGYGNGLKNKEMPFYENFYAGGFNTVRGFQLNNIGPKAVYYKDLVKYISDIDNKKNLNKFYNSYDAVGGNAMLITGVEFIVPTPFTDSKCNNYLRTSLFLDAGTVWDSKWNKSKYPEIMDYSNFKKIRMSVGISFQWISPLGPLTFSYSKPFKKYVGDEIEQFQFNIGKFW